MDRLPTRAQILDFIQSSDTPIGKREIAKAFGIRGEERTALKKLLRAMESDGVLETGAGKKMHPGGGLPKVTILKVTHHEDGRAVAVPERWDRSEPPPRLRVVQRGRRAALGEGDRILARIEEAGHGYRAHLMKRIGRASEDILGILRKDASGFFLQPTDKKIRRSYKVADAGGADDGDLVLARAEGLGASVMERLGDPFAPRSISLIAIHSKGIPHEFPPEIIEHAKDAAARSLGEREDLRHLDIITIDPEDARDHDDALWAKRDGDGWRALVAIADVSYYVRPGTPLDREARKRGNSVYFPDRVVPMLPETLSADMCSLVADQDRGALACHLAIAPDGSLKSWRFSRAVIRCRANIAYEEAADHAGLGDLWSAWGALKRARDRREPLELDLPERQVELDAAGRVARIAVRERLDAHRLVEDFMIAANVAAAKALEAKRSPVVYRAHETPSREKIEALRDYLASLDVPFAKGQTISPSTFNKIIDAVDDDIVRAQVSEQVLRSQTQAYYSPDNLGHFGLALASYAHFTSPIRRYSDLLVHRALVRAYDLGAGGLTDTEIAELGQITEHISQTERRAMEAERDTVDRYVAAYLAEREGEIVETRITGVTKAGLFATVDGVGGDGLLPMRHLGEEYWRFDESARTLTGERSGTMHRPGDRLKLRLAEANPVTGALRFERPDGAAPTTQARGRKRRSKKEKKIARGAKKRR